MVSLSMVQASMAPSVARMPQEMSPPSKAGPAEQAQDILEEILQESERERRLFGFDAATNAALRGVADMEEAAGYGQTLANLEALMRYAVIVVSSLPLLIVYPFLQKYFDKGVMIGSVKG